MKRNVTAVCVVVAAISFVALAGCSSGEENSGLMVQESGVTIPADCGPTDYEGWPFATMRRPECIFMRSVADFSRPDVALAYTYVEAKAEPLVQSAFLSLPESLDDPVPAEDVPTVEEWVAQHNAEFRATIEGGGGSIRGTDYKEGDFFSPGDGDLTIVGDEVHGLYLLYAGTHEDLVSDSNSTISDGVLTFDDVNYEADGYRGEFVLIFAGHPTDANGTVKGNTVTWILDGSVDVVEMHAVGPVG